jgi:ATP-dependent DNA helicase RecG
LNKLDVLADRIEIHSPGNLYGRMTVDLLGTAKLGLRNPVLAVMTEYQTAAENRYSGIPTMRREMARYGLPEPVFEKRRNEFAVIFYNRREQANRPGHDVTEGSDALLQFCRTPRSRREIADYLGIKTLYYASAKYIQPLIDQGLLQMTIPDKPKSRNQRYYVNDKENQ